MFNSSRTHTHLNPFFLNLFSLITKTAVESICSVITDWFIYQTVTLFVFYVWFLLLNAIDAHTGTILSCFAPSAGRRGASPLQCGRVTLVLRRDWLPDAERGAFVWGCIQPGETGKALNSSEPRLSPAASKLQTSRPLKFFYLLLLTVDSAAIFLNYSHAELDKSYISTI